MRCTCKLKEKLAESEKHRKKWVERSARISKMIADREGKKLRLITWDYEGETTMYAVYSKYPTMRHGMSGNENVCFFDKGSVHAVPWSSNGGEALRQWKRNGSKISFDTITYYGKVYSINKNAQVCEVQTKRVLKIFKKTIVNVLIYDILKESEG